MAAQLERHADQLARYLMAQHQDLDRRESQLNARAAQLEQAERMNRLWLHEAVERAELQLQQHAARLAQREQQLAETQTQVRRLLERLRRQGLEPRSSSGEPGTPDTRPADLPLVPLPGAGALRRDEPHAEPPGGTEPARPAARPHSAASHSAAPHSGAKVPKPRSER